MLRRPSHSALTHGTDRGLLTLSEPAPRVILLRVEGYLELSFHAAAVELTERCVRRAGPVWFFMDRLAQQGEDPDYQRVSFKWLRERKGHIERIVMLQQGDLKNRLGAPLAPLFGLPKLYATSDRAEFERLLDRAIATHAPAPLALVP